MPRRCGDAARTGEVTSLRELLFSAGVFLRKGGFHARNVAGFAPLFGHHSATDTTRVFIVFRP
jgi:hypothetical protein